MAIGLAAWLQRSNPADVSWRWVTAHPGETFEFALSRSLHDASDAKAGGLTDIPGGDVDELEQLLLDKPVGRKFVLVIDDAQELRDTTGLRRLLELLERQAGFYLYVCCRGPHPIESMAAGAIAINTIELRGLLPPPDEVVNVTRAIGTLLDRQWGERLHTALGEWEATLKTMLAAADELGVRPSAVDEYLLTDVLPSIHDEALIGQLMRFSLPETVSWKLFRDLCDDPDPQRLFAALDSTGLIEHVGGPNGERMAMVAPVRHMLRQQYASTDPDGTRAFHLRLATWYSEHDEATDLVSQFHHAAAGADYEQMDRLWATSLWTLISQDAALMTATLEALPPEVLEGRPSMQVLRDLMKVAAVDTEDAHLATLRLFADTCAQLLRQHWDTMSVNELLIIATGYLIQLRLLGRFEDSASFGEPACPPRAHWQATSRWRGVGWRGSTCSEGSHRPCSVTMQVPSVRIDAPGITARGPAPASCNRRPPPTSP